MTTVDNLKKHVQQVAEEARHHMAEAQVARKTQHSQERVLALLEEQQQELKRLRHDLNKRSRSSSSFPWGLLLLAGAGYALYESNAGVREQVQGLLQRINPGVPGNTARAADAVKGAVSDLSHGRSPAQELHRAGGEIQRGGEKAVDQAQNALKD